MADRIYEKPRRGLFGGAKPSRPEDAPEPDSGAPQSDPLDSLIQSLNLKVLAAALAQGERAAVRPADPILQPTDSLSRAPRLEDIASPWFAYWTAELKSEVRAQRKLWEMVTVLQAFYQAGVLRPGSRAVGFGVGDEPLPSYLASLGLSVVAADQPGRADAARAWRPELVSRERFEALVEVSEVDVRRLDDPTLRGFDACWSCGVINELSSAHQAEETLINAMDVLRPGGVAVHIADFAFADEQLAQGGTQLTKAFFVSLAKALNGRGHKVAPLDFGLGDHPLDGYVDAPPFGETLLGGRFDTPHLKVLLGGAVRTSFAMIVTAR